MDHAFEDVAVKVNAPELLEDALRRKRRRCMVGTGSMSDPYLPLERETRLTRRCLEVIERQGFGVSVLTKSDLLLRDLDLLTRINQTAKAVVCTTFTTFDENLCRVLEPNVCTTRRRFEMLKTCHEAGIHTGVWLCPILPFLNDTEENLRGLLDYCFDAGVEAVVNFGMGVTLREGDRVRLDLSDAVMARVNLALTKMWPGWDHLKGFVRFSELDGVLVGEMEPKNRVLPLLAPHFAARYSGERLALYDRTHHAIFLSDRGRWKLLPAEDFRMGPAGSGERACRAMWRRYYDTIAIEGRTNPKCQSTHLPKRYRHVMTEFLTDEEMERALPKGGAGARPLGEGRMVPPQI